MYEIVLADFRELTQLFSVYRCQLNIVCLVNPSRNQSKVTVVKDKSIYLFQDKWNSRHTRVDQMQLLKQNN